MAARRSSCAGGCLVKTLIAIVIVIALIVGAFIWAINQTPERFGLADYEIQGMTLREMGFAEMKIKDIAKLFKSLLKPDTSAIVDNPYDPVEDKASADSKAGTMGIPQEGGQTDYLSLMGDTPVTTGEPELLTFADTEIAYILNSIVTQASTAAEGEEEAQVVRDLNASIAQVTILKGTQTTLEILLQIDISSMKGELPAIVANRLPDVIYLNSINTLTISEALLDQGTISTESVGIEINGMDGATTNILISALSSGIEGASEAEDPAKYFNDTFGAFFQKVINNMGLVGDADLDDDDDVILLSIDYGPEGVINHGIKVITRVLPL